MPDTFHSTHAALLFALTALAVATAPAFAQQVPPAGTPGGARPQIEETAPGGAGAPAVITQPEAQLQPCRDETGARMQVAAFRLAGVVDRPQFGISGSELATRVESLRAGYRQGLGICELREVTRSITNYYRARGLFLARAYVPEQSVRDGVVTVRILEGVLADVASPPQCARAARPEAGGASLGCNEVYDIELLRRPFEDLLGEPVHRDSIEREMLRINTYPGYTGSGVFRPGAELGTTTLVLDTRRETRFAADAWFDNHGTELTGENRLYGRVQLNNALGQAEQFRFLALQTLDPDNATFLSADYAQPIISPEYRLDAGFSQNTFSVGDVFEQLDIEGESTIMRGTLSRQFLLSRTRSLSAHAGVARKSASSTQSGTNIGEDELLVLSGGGRWDFLDEDGRSGNALQGTLSLGIPEVLGAMDSGGDPDASRVGGSGDRAGGDFTKLNLEYSRSQALPAREFFRNQVLLLRARLQFSSDLLTSLERMSLGGPNSVRAYPPSEFLADTATVLNVEWQARSVIEDPDSIWHNLLVAAFVDYADGELNDPLTNEEGTVTLLGIGGGVQFRPTRKLTAKFELATAIGDPEPSNEKSLQTFFSFRYDF